MENSGDLPISILDAKVEVGGEEATYICRTMVMPGERRELKLTIGPIFLRPGSYSVRVVLRDPGQNVVATYEEEISLP